ncbi:unnamed protein product, partial [Rotaria socialis]
YLNLATGAAALMAIRVLLDHNVPEDKIALLSLLVSKQGVLTVAYAFPKVKIVTTAYDTQLDQETGFICPGLGNFGDRYFGTDPIVSDNEDIIYGQCGYVSSQSVTPNSPQQSSKLNHSNRDLSPLNTLRSNDHEEVFQKI